MIIMLLIGLISAVMSDTTTKSPLMLSVGIPEMHGRRTLPINRTFPLILINTSEYPLKLWRDTCSWGYVNPILEMQGIDPEKNHQWLILNKFDKYWARNIPDAALLAPGESMVLNLDLKEDIWKNFEFLATRVGKKVRMRVVYRNFVDEQTIKLKVWTGELRTAAQEYVVVKP